MWHNLFIERGNERVRQMYVNWIVERL